MPLNRSEIMSRIGSKDTKPELKVRRFLHKHGYRFRLHAKGLPGKPDIVLPKYKTAMFVNGCFWHMHRGCKHSKMPKTNKKFWRNKLNRNVERDIGNVKALRALGWNVLTIWECEIKAGFNINP